MCKMLLNNNLNGVELYFEVKPERSLINQIKEVGFRFNASKLCWYAKQNEKTISAAEQLSAGIEAIAPVIETKKVNLIDLWSLTRIDKSIVNDSSLQTKEISKQVRSFLKKRFPYVKFSIKTRKTGYSSSIDCDIIESPFEKDSIYLNAIIEYCRSYINTYNWDNSDPYTDYSHVNFYGGYFQLDYDYKATEAGTEIIEAMKNYDQELKLFNQAEEERKEKEFQEYLIREEEAKKQRQIREEEEKKEVKLIKGNVVFADLEENNQYYIKDAYFANLNKNNTLAQYEEEVASGKYYLNTLKVTREVKFTDKKALEAFKKNLLNDFDFIDGTGGSYTDDSRINSMTDFYNMSSTEQKSVEWILQGIAVYFNDKLVFVVDAQGYSYARYVGLIGDITTTTKEYNCIQVLAPEELEELKQEAELIEEVYNEAEINNNWYEYRKNIVAAMKKNRIKPGKKEIQQIKDEKIKSNMYKAIKETDTITDQFKGIEIEAGEGITVVRLSMIGGADTQQGYYMSHEEDQEKIKMTYKPKNNRNLYISTLKSSEEILIYKGWISLPKEVLYNIVGKTEATKYGSYDKQAMEDILYYLNNNGIKPIVNTFKPLF